MFVRNEKQYIWPFVVLGLSVLSFVPWILNKCDVPLAMTFVREAVSDYLLFVWLPTLGNVLVVACLILWFGAPIISDMLKERKETIEKSIDDAAHVRRDAETQYHEASEKIDHLDHELQEIRASYAKSIDDEKRRIEEETARQENRIATDAETVYALQTGVATRAFEREVMSDALNRARDEIVRKLESDPLLRDRLIDRGIATLNLKP